MSAVLAFVIGFAAGAWTIAALIAVLAIGEYGVFGRDPNRERKGGL